MFCIMISAMERISTSILQSTYSVNVFCYKLFNPHRCFVIAHNIVPVSQLLQPFYSFQPLRVILLAHSPLHQHIQVCHFYGVSVSIIVVLVFSFHPIYEPIAITLRYYCLVTHNRYLGHYAAQNISKFY